MRTVLVTGGAGYVGSVLVPKLLQKDYRVRVLDLYLYGRHVFNGVGKHPRLEQIEGDLRDQALRHRALLGCDDVIHLACISNDPSFELDPELGKSINYDSFEPLVRAAVDNGVSRFIYASSSSVYGLKEEKDVTEDLPLEPLTDYSKYKVLCEERLLKYQSPDFTTAIIRPATVCGYSPRQRLDLTVNILTNHAVNTGRIRVFGGQQRRPNIHIEDITDLYVQLLELPADRIAGRVYNAGYENHRISEIAQIVKEVVGNGGVEIVTEPTDDLRSYHISSEKIRREIGFEPRHSIEDAVADLCRAFSEGRIPDPMDDTRYYNVQLMKAIDLN